MNSMVCCAQAVRAVCGRILYAFLTIWLAAVMAGCSDSPSLDESEPAESKKVSGFEFRIGMYLDSSGLGDRGFMDMQYKGLVRGCRKHGAAFVIEQRPDDYDHNATVQGLKSLVDKGCRAIFCTSYSMESAMVDVATRHPEVIFILMDTSLDEYRHNMASATFRTGEAAYLAGYLAANMSTKKVVGAIGGMPVRPVEEFINGFEAGILAAEVEATLITRYINTFSPEGSPWNSPNAAAEIAAGMVREHGADVFFPVAGASAIGVYNFVMKQGRYAIGVDSDQDYLAEGHILTSVMKHLDVAVESLIGEIVEGRFRSGDHHYDLANGGVGLSPMHYTRELIPEAVLERLEELRQLIIAGDIEIPAVQ
ncbi:BMP family lipoprotein [Salidesulfovibrio brasiliensis]